MDRKLFNSSIADAIQFLETKSASEILAGLITGKDYTAMSALLIRAEHSQAHVRALVNGVFEKGHGVMTVLRQIPKEMAQDIIVSVGYKTYTKTIGVEYSNGVRVFENIDWERIALQWKVKL